MKKAIAILLLLLLSLSLFAGCGNKKSTSADPSSTPPETSSNKSDASAATPTASDTPTDESSADASLSPSSDPTSPTPTSEDPSPTPPPSDFPSDAKVTAKKEGTAVKVQLTAASLAKKEISLVLIKDPSYQYTWSEDTEGRLCDLAQICLDDKGEGTVTLQLGDAATAYLVVSTEDGLSTILTVN